jgi:hypothetical protein
MSDNITGFYRSVLTLPRVDSSMQVQVFNHGSRRGDQTLLAMLAARTDLISQLDTELGKVDGAVVKVAWASRPERTEDDLVTLVRTEKRVKVLAALAARDDLPAALYDAIANHARSTALEALLLNMTVDVATKVTAATRYATQINGKRLSRNTNSLLAQEPEIAEAIARHTDNFHLGAAAIGVIGSVGSPEAFMNVVKLALSAMSSSEGNGNWETYNAIELIGTQLFENPSRDEELTKSYLDALRKVAVGFKGSYLANRYDSIADTLAKTSPKSGGGSDLVAAARGVSNDAEARALVTLFIANRDTIPGAALMAAARNDAVTSEILLDLLDHSRYSWYASRDLMWAYPRLSAEKAAAIHVAMSWLNDDSLLSRHPEPAKVLRKTARLASRRGVVPSLLLNSRFITDEVIDELPFSVFRSDESVPLAVTERIANKVQSRLGDDAAAWETLGVLAADFTGSVSELIEVAIRV